MMERELITLISEKFPLTADLPKYITMKQQEDEIVVRVCNFIMRNVSIVVHEGILRGGLSFIVVCAPDAAGSRLRT